jgi:hypothetical protein
MHNPYQFPQDGLQSEDVPAVTDGKAKVEIMAGAPVGSTQVSRRAFLGGAMTIAGGALASSFLAHLSHYVLPGAKRLDIRGWTGYDNLLVFLNPDKRRHHDAE